MADDTHDAQSFHQGFNAAAFIGLCALGYFEVISGTAFVVLLLALIGFYTYRYR
jgi:hypothetical protein